MGLQRNNFLPKFQYYISAVDCCFNCKQSRKESFCVKYKEYLLKTYPDSHDGLMETRAISKYSPLNTCLDFER